MLYNLLITHGPDEYCERLIYYVMDVLHAILMSWTLYMIVPKYSSAKHSLQLDPFKHNLYLNIAINVK